MRILVFLDRYAFVCNNWLSPTRGDGKTTRHIPVLDTSLADGGSLFDILSKRKLYNDHLWLSVAKRPTYSVFSRVQRFLCAVALLYLAMITNAMFYQTEQEDGGNSSSSDVQNSGLQIGIVRVTYRTVYVGIFSSIIIVIPGFLMTCMFRNRKLKLSPSQKLGVRAQSSKCATSTSSSSPSHTGVSEPRLGPNRTQLNEAEVNYAFVEDEDGSNMVTNDSKKNDLKELFRRLDANTEGAADIFECSKIGSKEGLGTEFDQQNVEGRDSSANVSSRTSSGKIRTPTDIQCAEHESLASSDLSRASTGKVPTPVDDRESVASSCVSRISTVTGVVENDYKPRHVTAKYSSLKEPPTPVMAELTAHSLPGQEKCDLSRVPTFTSTGFMSLYELAPSNCSGTSQNYSPKYVPKTDAGGVKGDVPSPAHYSLKSNVKSVVHYSDTIETFDVIRHQQLVHRKKYEVKTEDEESMKIKGPSCLLPWWSAIVGYCIVFLSIATSASFTFFYSLEWGGETSLQWMASLFFSATTGTLLLEPLKIVLVALLLTCLLRDSAQNELAEIAPVTSDCDVVAPEHLQAQWRPLLSETEATEAETEKSSKDIEKERKQLKLR
ncbi:uncharacterized protein LOC101864095, partial [Aplysia californica]|uniref:Uncharacterized protein LOC101864095 n=1 Tax=Aplysia californica TaxID=6500 RepID=A0ABM1AA58_APLCA